MVIIKGVLEVLLNKIKKAYANLNPDSREGRCVRQMRDSIDELHNKFYKALKSASENIYNTNVDTTKNTANDDGVKYSFAGRKAKNSNHYLIQKAQFMIEDGVDSETIRKETGWYKGYDNKWRFEIDDSKMTITQSDRKYLQETSSTLLGYLINHNELFKSYPQLRDIMVYSKDTNGDGDAYYDPKYKSITISSRSLRTLSDYGLKSILIHEIQHAIQDIEGFTPGTDTSDFAKFLNTAGEIEAYDTSDRVDFTADQRKNTRPDIDRTSVVFGDNNDVINNSNETIIDLSDINEISEKVQGIYGSQKYKIIQQYILDVLGGEKVVLSDGKEALVDKSDALHIANKSANRKTAEISKIKELVKTAILYAEDTNPTHNKFDYFCYYRVLVRYKNDTYPVYLNVGKAKNDNSYHIYDITKNIKDTANRINGLERPKTSKGYALQSGISTSIISDTTEKSNRNSENSDTKLSLRDNEYLEAVNNGDMETAQRMVDEYAEEVFANSKIRDEDGKLLKVYHGTYEDFTVFDKTKGRTNMDIQGMFFSPWDIDAKGYGPNVRAFYLNITNPANESTGYKALRVYTSQNNAGVKARGYLEKLGYDGVNNENEEFIAFNSEQIKSADPVTYDDNGNVIPLSKRFDTENEDIRYSQRDYSYDALVSKPDMKITKVDDTISYDVNSHTRKFVVNQGIDNAKLYGEVNDGAVSVYVDDIESNVIVSKKSLVHGIDRRLQLSAPVIINIGSIVKNSVLINEMTPKKNYGKRELCFDWIR